MQHVLFAGVTQTGKTTLARKFANSYAQAGKQIIIYDPVNTPTKNGGWPTGKKIITFSDSEEFADHLAYSGVSNAHVFVDEADNVLSLKHPENHWLLMRGRHFALQINVITQRPNLVAPSVRAQCTLGYIFRLTRDDMRSIGADFGHDLQAQKQLDRGEFFVVESGLARFSRSSI